MEMSGTAVLIMIIGHRDTPECFPPWLQIVFQHMARHHPLTVEMLLASLGSTATCKAPAYHDIAP